MIIFLLQVDTVKTVIINAGFSLSDYKDIAIIIGAIIGGATLVIGLLEYAHQGKQKRAEHFFNLRKKLKENLVYKRICSLLETDSKELLGISFEDKRDFLGLFEEIAIMKRSRLIKPEATYYMFGYYAVKCWDSINFWSSVNKESVYWKVFSEFVSDAKKFEANKSNFNIDDIKI